MNKEEVLALIDDLHVGDERKQALRQQVETSGITPELVQQLRAAYDEAEAAIRTEHAGDIEELEKIYHAADKEVDQAYQEFQNEMTAVDKEAEKIYDDASEQAEQLNLDDARAAIK